MHFPTVNYRQNFEAMENVIKSGKVKIDAFFPYQHKKASLDNALKTLYPNIGGLSEYQ